MAMVVPTELLSDFDIDSLTLQFVRDIETLSWVKDDISSRLGKQIYKAVTILDMKGFGSKHMAGKFRTPAHAPTWTVL